MVEAIMRRRTLLGAGIVTAVAGAAHAQEAQEAEQAPVAAPGISLSEAAPSVSVAPIEPENALEYAFVSALTNEAMRPVFRRYLLDTHIVMAMTNARDNAEPLEVELQGGQRAVAVFTSATRINAVLGADAPRITLNGRAALERLNSKNVVINYRLIPMLTIEPEDVQRYLATPGSGSAGPTQ
jgi:hypothetical protein